MRPLLSICIPAFNRASLLPQLLQSIADQCFDRDCYEIVIHENCSPERLQIRNVVESHQKKMPGVIRYFENAENLGYDGNLRALVHSARGEYCVFMGNDDLMCAGSLSAIRDAVAQYSGVGVVLRSYASFSDDPSRPLEVYRYFGHRRFFPPGAPTIQTLYRRSVVMSGMVVHRDSAERVARSDFDGTLLYQLYLVASLLVERGAVFLPEIVALYRVGGTPDFGASASEKGTFVPREQTVDSSIAFMRGMLGIARTVERERGVTISDAIERDIAMYAFPILAIQAHRPRAEFRRYVEALGALGLKRHLAFRLWCLAISILGAGNIERAIRVIKRHLGRTPAVGGIYLGRRQ